MHLPEPGQIFEDDWDVSFDELPDLDPMEQQQPELIENFGSSDEDLPDITGPAAVHPPEQLPEPLDAEEELEPLQQLEEPLLQPIMLPEVVSP